MKLTNKQKAVLHNRRLFVNVYKNKFLHFFLSHSKYKATDQQIMLMKIIDNPEYNRIAISSGHGVGKTTIMGFYALYFFLVYDFPIICLSGSDYEQIGRTTWKELLIAIQNVGIYNQWLTFFIKEMKKKIHTTIYKDEVWQIFKKTTRRNHPETMAGTHAENMLFIVEEASGVEEEVLFTILGACTQKNNKVILISQRTRDTGLFYRAFNVESLENGGTFKNITLNAEHSPIVSKQSLINSVITHGGRDSPGYLVRVKGEAAESSRNTLLKSMEVLEVYKKKNLENKKKIEGSGFGYIASIDVSEGVFRDRSVLTISKSYGYDNYNRFIEPIYIKEFPRNKKALQFSIDLIAILREYSNILVVVDGQGAGSVVYENLLKEGIFECQKVVWGKPPFLREEKNYYKNLRAKAYVLLARRIQNIMMYINKKSFQSSLSEARCTSQLTNILYEFTGRSQYKIISKEDMKSMGLESPDIADTLAFNELFFPPLSNEEIQISNKETVSLIHI